jgi:hypothetical protein
MVCMWWWCCLKYGWAGGGGVMGREPPTGLGVLKLCALVVLQLLCELGVACPAALPWYAYSRLRLRFRRCRGLCWLFQLPFQSGPSSLEAKPKPFDPLLPGFLARSPVLPCLPRCEYLL